MHDPLLPPCLRLLPIETRLQNYSLAQWRSRPSTWVEVALDENDPDQIAQQISQVTQTRTVTIDEARQMGFWSDAMPLDNPEPDAQGLVEIPRWRHAVVNVAHPLLQHGLVILDTPGLNTVGTEPELSVNQIAQADTVVFLLSFEEGVTPSDLAVWHKHISPLQRQGEAHLVVLNKLDKLWSQSADEQQTQEQIQERIQRQRQHCAKVLGVQPERVLALSAKHGRLAKHHGETELLERSGLLAFEDMLARGILRHRQSALRGAVQLGVQQMRAQIQRTLTMRINSMRKEIAELAGFEAQGAQEPNHPNYAASRQRLEQRLEKLSSSQAMIHALRTQHLRLMNQAFHHLGATARRRELDQLRQALQHSSLELGVRQVYASAFERMREIGAQVSVAALEVQKFLTHSFAELNVQFDLTLQAPQEAQLGDFMTSLEHIEESYLQYLSFDHVRKLANPLFGERLIKALGRRWRTIFEDTGHQLDIWSKAATSELDVQLKERRRSVTRRIECLRILENSPDPSSASSSLSQHLQERRSTLAHLLELEQQLQQWDDKLQSLPQL